MPTTGHMMGVWLLSHSINPNSREVAPRRHEHFLRWRSRLGDSPVCQRNPFLGAELAVLHTVLLEALQILIVLA